MLPKLSKMLLLELVYCWANERVGFCGELLLFDFSSSKLSLDSSILLKSSSSLACHSIIYLSTISDLINETR